jgi:AcrR family transcriptional regulator
MARLIDETAHLSKRNEILDCAQRLIYTTGYEQMSIQEICTFLGISKGAFYHYFDSKPSLLEALLNRTSQQAVEIIFPILEDPTLPALKKLEKFYENTNNWKSTQKPYLLAILKAWYTDENAIVRQKLLTYFGDRFSESLDKVFQEGIEEGVFHPAYPEMAGNIVYSLMVQMSDSIGGIMLSALDSPEASEEPYISKMDDLVKAYTDAIERVLGANSGSIHLIDVSMLKDWLPSAMNQELIQAHTAPIEKEYQL